MQSTTKLEQIGSTRNLSATRGKKSAQLKLIESRAKKDEEKTLKYGPMMWELKERYNGYRVERYNVIIDVLGGYSKHLKKSTAFHSFILRDSSHGQQLGAPAQITAKGRKYKHCHSKELAMFTESETALLKGEEKH
ncbi:unnamed protein product, partial [Porites evermanni]